MQYDYIGYFDGACYPKNPGGTGGWAWRLESVHGNLRRQDQGALPAGPGMTNNVAEHCACANLLQEAHAHLRNGQSLLIRGDAMMVVNQLSGKWKAKRGKYIEQYRRGISLLHELEDHGVKVRFEWIPREENTECDERSGGGRVVKTRSPKVAAIQAKLDKAIAELEKIKNFAILEKIPLRQQDIESIECVLAAIK